MPPDALDRIQIRLRGLQCRRRWTGASAGIYFYDAAGPGALKLYRFATGKVERVLSPVPPPMEYSRGLAVSPDERQVLWVQFSRRISQILLVEGFR